MVALEVWYSQDQDTGLIVRDAAELDAVLDTIADQSTAEWATFAQLSFTHDGTPAPPLLGVGFRGDVGVLFYSDTPDTAYYSHGSGSPAGTPLLYMYMTSDTEFPPNAEIPAYLVRQAVHQLLATRTRPTCVKWQTWNREPASASTAE